MKYLTLLISLSIFNCIGQEIDSLSLMRIQMLEEVSVDNIEMKKDNYILGTYTENTRLLGLEQGFTTGCYNDVAVYIPSDNKRSIIESILINVRNLDSDSMFSISLYSIDTSKAYKIPSKLIFSYTLSGKLIRHSKLIDISALKLKIPENGLFVAFRGWDFDYKTTDNINTKRTLMRIEGGIYKDKWLNLTGNKKIENARFGLLMQKR